MKPIEKIKWEDIFSVNRECGQFQFNTARSQVKGGWLITHAISFKHKLANSTCFIPDENHEWELKDE